MPARRHRLTVSTNRRNGLQTVNRKGRARAPALARTTMLLVDRADRLVEQAMRASPFRWLVGGRTRVSAHRYTRKRGAWHGTDGL